MTWYKMHKKGRRLDEYFDTYESFNFESNFLNNPLERGLQNAEISLDLGTFRKFFKFS